MIVGPPATTPVAASARPASREILTCFEDAFRQRRMMSFAYEDRHGKTSTRTVEPHGLLIQTPVWYVLTREPGGRERRMFRMDRISRPSVDARAFVPSFEVVDAFARELESINRRS